MMGQRAGNTWRTTRSFKRGKKIGDAAPARNPNLDPAIRPKQRDAGAGFRVRLGERDEERWFHHAGETRGAGTS
jgi:hypothetical protein